MAVTVITQDNFKSEVLESSVTVLADFWASWCGPCRMLSPLVDQVAEERKDIKVVKINVDECPQLAMQYGVQSIPTLLVFRGGKVVNSSIGAVPKDRILALL